MPTFNLSRRATLRGISLCAAVPAIALPALSATARRALATEPAPSAITPDQALEMLKAGNAEYSRDAPFRGAEDRNRRTEIAKGQHPFAIVVGCADSRVPPELLFARGLGEIFVIRVAGNTIDPITQGSIEYAVDHLGVPLILVLGHERCGAVAAAVEVVEKNAVFPGSIGAMVDPIIPAVLSVRDSQGDLVANSVRANVTRVIQGLRASSQIAQHALGAGELKIVGGVYDLDDGVVDFFEA